MFISAICVLFLIKLRWLKKKNLYNILAQISPRSLKGRKGGSPPSDFFAFKSERLDQLPKTLAELFLDNEYMFWH